MTSNDDIKQFEKRLHSDDTKEFHNDGTKKCKKGTQ